MSEKVDITPSWKTAVAIYVEVLLNCNDRYSDSFRAAREDLMRLADVVDLANDGMSNPIDPRQLTLEFES